MKPRKTAEMKTPMRIPLTTERKAILKKLQPLPESEYAIPDNRMETFAAGHDTAHLHVLAAGGLIGWTQSEKSARENVEKAKERLPEEFRWQIHTLIAAALLKDHKAVAKLAEKIKPNAPDENTVAALKVVRKEPQKFVQAVEAMRHVDPRTAVFGTPSASTPIRETGAPRPTRRRGNRT